MLTSWVDETPVATCVPSGNTSGSKFSNDWSCRWLVDLAQEGQRTKSCLPCISSWWWFLVFCESSPRSQWHPCSSTRFDHAKQGIGGCDTRGSASLPIEPSLFLRKFELIQLSPSHRWYGFRSWFVIAGRGRFYLYGPIAKATVADGPNSIALAKRWTKLTLINPSILFAKQMTDRRIWCNSTLKWMKSSGWTKLNAWMAFDTAAWS